MRSRLPLWIGLLAALFAAQVFWWGVVIWRTAENERAARYEALVEERRRVAAELPGEAGDPEFAAAWQARAAAHPELALVPGSGLQISADALAEINRQRDRTHRMVLSEGALFAVLAALAVGLLIRTWKREQYLVLQQSNFLHAVTHELRSPLQSLRLALETLQRRPTPERAARYTGDMTADVNRLETLVDQLLAVGRLDAAAFDAQTEAVDLAAAVRERVDAFCAARPDAAALIRLEADEPLTAEADPATLDPIVRNLLDNAIKYGEGSPVQVAVRQDGADALLLVADQGRGLAAEDLPRVFDRFWRSGDERTRTAPGTGLGLFLVRELLHAQGARIRVVSAGPGQGTRFELRWRLA